MMPGWPGLKVTVTLPFLPVFTVFEIPGPVIFTVAPATPFLPFLTLMLIFCALPVAFSTFGVTMSVSQISGATTGGFGFTVGGVTGAVTSVEAEAVLLSVLVSGVVVLTMTLFTFVPVALTVALTVIETDAPAARLEIVQSSALLLVEVIATHVPADVVADTNVTSTGAASATFTFAADPSPMFVTTRL